MKKLICGIILVSFVLMSFMSFGVSAADNEGFPYTSGYCAVGEVNGSIATILVESGEIFTVRYTGTATAGDIHSYSYSDGTLTLAPVDWTFIWEDGVNGWPFWSWNGILNMDMSYGYSNNLETGAPVAFFIYYGPTEWRVLNGSTMDLCINQSGAQTCLMLLSDNSDHGIYEYNQMFTNRYIDVAMIVGTGVEGAEERIPADSNTTYFLDNIGIGWDDGDKIVTAANAVNCVVASETEAPVTDAPATDAPSTDTPAPDTGSYMIAVSAAALVLGAVAVAVAKNGKKKAL